MDWHWQGQGIICTLSWFNHKTCQIFLFNFHHFRRCWRRVPSVAKRPAGKPEQLQGASGQHAHRWHSQHLHTHCHHFPIINSQRQVHAFNVWPTADLPELFNGSQETENCLGAALQAAYKMVKFVKIKTTIIVLHHNDIKVNPTGGRITVVQGSLPNIGPGAVENREAGAGGRFGSLFILLPSWDPSLHLFQLHCHHLHACQFRVRQRWWSCWTRQRTSTSGSPSSAAGSRSLSISLSLPGGWTSIPRLNTIAGKSDQRNANALKIA